MPPKAVQIESSEIPADDRNINDAGQSIIDVEVIDHRFPPIVTHDDANYSDDDQGGKNVTVLQFKITPEDDDQKVYACESYGK
jgi:hypothetical protein